MTMGTVSSQDSDYEDYCNHLPRTRTDQDSNTEQQTEDDGTDQTQQGGWGFLSTFTNLSLLRRRQGPDLYDDRKSTAITEKNSNGGTYNWFTNRKVNRRYLDGQTPLTAAIRADSNDKTCPNLHKMLESNPSVDVNYPESRRVGLFSYNKGPPLIVATRIGNVGAVALLLKHGADLGATDSRNYSALHYAAALCNLEIANLLLENDPNLFTMADRHSTLKEACRTGHLQIIRILVENDTSTDINGFLRFIRCPITMAIEHKREDACLYLLDKIPDIKRWIWRKDLLVDASWSGCTRVVKYLIEKGVNVNSAKLYNIPALVRAIRPGEISSLSRCLRIAQGETRLGILCQVRTIMRESVEILEMLCKNKADIEVKTVTSFIERVPLYYCLNAENIPAAIVLLKHGARIDKQFNSVFEKKLYRIDPEHYTVLLQFLDNKRRYLYKPKYYPCNVIDLKDSCRHVIRSQVHRRMTTSTSILRALRRLPLPPLLKDYLCYSEIDILDIINNFDFSYLPALN